MSLAPAVEVTGLAHAYGARRVLDGLDWRVEGPGVYGFLGVNGAGKTTTLRALGGALRPSGGQVRVLGRSPEDPLLIGRVSALQQAPDLYPWMSVLEHLLLLGELRGMRREVARQEADRLLERVDLVDAANKRAGALSGGMRQRLALAGALLGEPALLLLDEPLSALDPVGRRLVMALLTEVGKRATVIFSTHILPDLERACDRVAVLHRGRICAFDTPANLVARAGPAACTLEVDGDPAALLAALSNADWVSSVQAQGPALTLVLRDEARALRALPALIAELGLGLRALTPQRADLESAFLQLIGEAPAARTPLEGAA